MKLGIAMNLPHSAPEEWALKHKQAGLQAVVFPCQYSENISVIDAYANAAREQGLVIAEVGAWCNVNDLNRQKKEENIAFVVKQLELAEYVKAKCCVNISGAKGAVWDGAYPGNYSRQAYDEIVNTTQRIIDAVNPVNTCYSLEPMPYMLPDSPESYLQLCRDIDRRGFKVHLDVVNMISSVERYFHNSEFIAHCFSLLGSIAASCHIKDCILENKLTLSITETECGRGGVDLQRYIAEADRLNPDLPMIIEHLSDAEQYFAAIRHIRSLGGTHEKA